MVCTTWYKPTTNIQQDKELFELLTEINELSPNELFIEQRVGYKRKLFKVDKHEWFSIYWDVGKGEYQCIMSFESLDRQDILCYLLGILTGIDKSKNVSL